MPLSTQHSIYEINILECYRDLIKHLESDSTFKLNKDPIRYFQTIRSSVSSYARLKGFQKNFTEFAKKEFFYIDQEHESFNNWLCFKLSISEPHEVALLLDHFLKNTKKPKARFINEMENLMLKLMKTHIHHNIPDVKKEIVDWIRTEKNKLTQKDFKANEDYDDSFRYNNPKPLDYNIANLKSIESFIDTFAPFSWLKELNSKSNQTDKEDIQNRIETDLSYDEIMDYFGQLNNMGRNGQEIMSMTDIRILVKSNFKVEDKAERKVFDINLSKEALKKFIYQFYFRKDQRQTPGKQLEYCHLLINNFEKFRNDKVDALSKKLSSANPSHYPFD